MRGRAVMDSSSWTPFLTTPQSQPSKSPSASQPRKPSFPPTPTSNPPSSHDVRRAAGKGQDWNLLWKTAYDLLRIARIRYLHYYQLGGYAAREEGLGLGIEMIWAEGGEREREEREIYWECCAMLVRLLPFSLPSLSFFPAVY